MRCVILLVSFWVVYLFFFFKQKTAYEMRIRYWSSDVCSSDLRDQRGGVHFFQIVDQLRQILDRVDVVVRRRRDQANARFGITQPRDGGVDLVAGQQIGRASCRERVCQYV